MKVWLDDVRPMPEGFDIWMKTVDDAIALLEEYDVAEISLDHDLGEGKDGYDLAKWIEFQSTQGLPRLLWQIHSQNPVGVKNMTAALEMADRYWRAVDSTYKNHKAFPIVVEHFRGDHRKAATWFIRKDPALGAKTPVQLMLNDEHDVMMGFIEENFNIEK